MGAKYSILTISIVVAIACSILGCRSTHKVIQDPYKELTLPSSFTLHLHVSNPTGAPDAIIKAIMQNISSNLLMRDMDVKIASDLSNKETDGMLLQIDILRAFQGGVSKRIDIRYQLINRSNDEVMINGKDSVSSKFGYNKITVALGNRVSAKVTRLINSLKHREKGANQSSLAPS